MSAIVDLLRNIQPVTGNNNAGVVFLSSSPLPLVQLALPLLLLPLLLLLLLHLLLLFSYFGFVFCVAVCVGVWVCACVCVPPDCAPQNPHAETRRAIYSRLWRSEAAATETESNSAETTATAVPNHGQ